MLSKMKQYLDKQQTSKLIELGFENPVDGWTDMHYSIGELLSFLPISFETDNDDTSWLEIEAGAVWSVTYSSFGFIDYDCERKELIDALFDMIVTLKEEGVI